MTTLTKTSRDPYQQAHDRVRAIKGKASEHLCVLCQGPAREWALKPKSECLGTLSVVRHRDLAFWVSDDHADYRALCPTDHRQADAEEREQERLQVDGVLDADPYAGGI